MNIVIHGMGIYNLDKLYGMIVENESSRLRG
jgi:hypothetical protein